MCLIGKKFGMVRTCGVFVSLVAFTSGPVNAAGISIANIGNNSAAAGASTLAITTTAACPAGSVIAVHTAIVISGVTISGLSDSVGNTYVAGASATPTGGRHRLWVVRALQNAGLPNGSTITISYGNTTGIKMGAAACVSAAMVGGPGGGGPGLETEPTPTTGTSTAPSLGVITSAPLSPAEMVICGYLVVSGAADAFTNTSGFSPLTRVNNTAALDWEYKVTSDFNSVTCAPTLGASSAWGAVGRSILQTQGSRMMMMGS